MEILSTIWMISIVITIAMCAQKNLNGWWVFWAFFFGPVVAIMAYLREAQPGKVNPDLISNLQTEITTLKLEVRALERRLWQLEKGETSTAAEDRAVPPPEPAAPEPPRPVISVPPPVPEPVQVPDPVPEPQPTPVSRIAVSQPATAFQTSDNGKQPSSAEINFGQFWLNKIGIVIFTLGVGFFISYSFQYFSPLVKDLVGYVIAGILFYLGRRFEKQEPMKNYGLALLGAGWALTYFTTYALHHFEASRVIESPAVDTVLLFAVAAGMMVHAARARSETMMMVSLGVAYVTSLIGEVTSFTFISAVILGCVVVFLLYRFQWVKTLFLGIGMTYGIHFLFVGPAIDSGELLTWGGGAPGPSLELMFLAAYAALYFLGTHLVKGRSQAEQDCVAAGNFINFSLFFLLSSPVFQEFYPERRVVTLAVVGVAYLSAGLLMRWAGRQRMYASDIIVALFSFTLATHLKFFGVESLWIWLIQTPFLLLVGMKFRDRVLVNTAHALGILCLLAFIDKFFGVRGELPMELLGGKWYQIEISTLLGAVAMAICYAVLRLAKDEKFRQVWALKFYGILVVIYGTIFLLSKTYGPWQIVWLMWEIPVLVAAGRFAREPVWKGSGLWLAVLVLVKVVFQGMYTGDPGMIHVFGEDMSNEEWTYFFGSKALWTAFGLSRAEAMKVAREGSFNVDNHVYSFFGTLLLNMWLCRVLHNYWITVAFGVEAVVLINAALLFTLKRLRIYGYLLLAVSLVRFIGIDDYAGLGAGRWALIIFEMAVFLGLYIVSVLKRDEGDREVRLDEMETVLLFAGFMAALLVTVFQHADPGWRSLSLGGAAAGTVALGLAIKDRTARLGGFLVLGLALLRIVFIDLAKLTTIYKIISFIAIGALLLGLSFLYNKYFSGEQAHDKSGD